MTERIQISAVSPEGYRKVNGLDAYVSSNRTCEIGLQQGTGRPYRHVAQLVHDRLRPG